MRHIHIHNSYMYTNTISTHRIYYEPYYRLNIWIWARKIKKRTVTFFYYNKGRQTKVTDTAAAKVSEIQRRWPVSYLHPFGLKEASKERERHMEWEMGSIYVRESEIVHDFPIKPRPRTSGEPRTFYFSIFRGRGSRSRFQFSFFEVRGRGLKLSEARPRFEASSKPRSEASENLGSRPRLAAHYYRYLYIVT